MISFQCKWRPSTACIIFKILRKDDSNMLRAFRMSLSHSNAMLRTSKTVSVRRPIYGEINMVSLSGWDCCHRWMMGHDPVKRSRVAGSFQQKSPLVGHLPGILGGEEEQKGENNKRKRQSRACQAASDSVFLKAFALISSSSFHSLFKREIHGAKRRRIRRARQLLNGNTGSQGKKQKTKKREIISSDHGDGSNKRSVSKINKEKIWNSTSHPSHFQHWGNCFVCL